jgi:hypothetical protein
MSKLITTRVKISMSPIIVPPPIVINKEQADAFNLAISKALASLTFYDLQQVYLFHDKSVVISYSSDYRPFIGFTMRYNDPDYRLYIDQDVYVLTRIGEALDQQGRDMPGGRVFIESSYVFIKDLNFNRITILLLDWQGYNPLNAVRKTYNLILDGKVSG